MFVDIESLFNYGICRRASKAFCGLVHQDLAGRIPLGQVSTALGGRPGTDFIARIDLIEEPDHASKMHRG
jgi:hypothetical protein